MNLQAKVLKAIREIAEHNGYDFTHNEQWANIGRVFIAPNGSFTNTLAFGYDFQDYRFSIQVYDGKHEIVTGMIPRTQPGLLQDFYIRPHESSKIDGMLRWFSENLPAKQHAVR